MHWLHVRFLRMMNQELWEPIWWPLCPHVILGWPCLPDIAFGDSPTPPNIIEWWYRSSPNHKQFFHLTTLLPLDHLYVLSQMVLVPIITTSSYNHTFSKTMIRRKKNSVFQKLFNMKDAFQDINRSAQILLNYIGANNYILAALITPKYRNHSLRTYI